MQFSTVQPFAQAQVRQFEVSSGISLRKVRSDRVRQEECT